MSVNKLDVVDLIIQTLQQHERRLDAVGERLEDLVAQLSKELNTCKATGVSDPK